MNPSSGGHDTYVSGPECVYNTLGPRRFRTNDGMSRLLITPSMDHETHYLSHLSHPLQEVLAILMIPKGNRNLEEVLCLLANRPIL